MTARTETISFDVSSILRQFDPSGMLDRYFDCLMRENARVNLVSRETSREDFNRLAAESLLPLAVMGRRFKSYLDIGSGGGLPAIPILLSAQINGDTCLLERTRKKAAALGRIVKALNLKATVLPETLEELTFSSRFNLATLRYVKLTQPLLERILAFLEPTGVLVYYSSSGLECSSASSVSYLFSTESGDATKSFTLFERQ